jgi:nucleoside-diphosphate-sugar epimerase
MASTKPSLLITGISGSLGTSLLPLLEGFNVIGIDTRPPSESPFPIEFEKSDMGQESSCHQMAQILRDTRAVGVVHLAFILDPIRMGVLDRDRMWRINVAGTARVLEAIAEANRMGGRVAKLIHLSSVAVYGPDLQRPARENDALKAHTLTYALHKKDADLAVQIRARELGDCDVYILRPHIFAGPSVQNYMIDCVRGIAYGSGRLGKMLQRRGKRLPIILPLGRDYLRHQLQFVHVDDVARVIAWLLRRPKAQDQVTLLNVAGRADALTVEKCAKIVGTRIKRLPTAALCRQVVELGWKLGITSVPPDAFPYLIGSYTLDTSKLRSLLGSDYERVIQHTSEEALAGSAAASTSAAISHAEAASQPS